MILEIIVIVLCCIIVPVFAFQLFYLFENTQAVRMETFYDSEKIRVTNLVNTIFDDEAELTLRKRVKTKF